MPYASSCIQPATVPVDGCCPRLPNVLSVLVCGHGPTRLPRGEAGQAALQEWLATLLQRALACAQDVFMSDARYSTASLPRLRIVTGKNDGADEAAAAAARSLDAAQLTFITPSGTGDALSGTERHLMFDYPGEQLSEAEAHVLAQNAREQLALAHADLVLAVWDGEGAEHGDSTIHLVRHAALACKPLVWINPHDLTAPHLLHRASLLQRHLAALQGPDRLAASLRTCFRPFDWAEFRREVQLQLAPTPGRDGAAELDDLFSVRLPSRFARERAGTADALLWHLAGLQLGRAGRDSLRLLFGAAGSRLARRLDASWQSVQPQPCGWLRAEAVQSPDAPPDALFAWTDEMATLMAGRHRASAWVVAIFGALAVLFAVWGAGADGAGETVAATAELLVLLVLIGLLLVARRRRWHRRWLFCRFVAEQLRLQAMLEPLLGTAPAAMRSPWRSTPEGLRFGEAGVWVVQRWLAGRGLNPAAPGAVRLDPSSAGPLRRAIAEQTAWLRSKRHELERQHRNMERLSAGLFIVAFGVVVAHFAEAAHLAHWHLGGQLLATAFLPAAGAAVASVLNQAEVQRVAHGYGHSAQRLQDLADAMVDEHHRAEQEKEGSYERWLHLMQVRRLGLEAGRLTAEENQAWYDLMLSRVPALP